LGQNVKAEAGLCAEAVATSAEAVRVEKKSTAAGWSVATLILSGAKRPENQVK
jgi:predicted secreted protein